MSQIKNVQVTFRLIPGKISPMKIYYMKIHHIKNTAEGLCASDTHRELRVQPADGSRICKVVMTSFFLCGHYEGIDERVLEETVTDYVSIGDYVLTGGELPSMVMIDAISRLVPGVLHNEHFGRKD